MVQFYPWIILVSFVSYSLSYIFISKNTGKNLNWSIKQKIKILSMYGQKKKNYHWLTQSGTGWLFVLKRFELSVGDSLCPTSYRYIPLPLRHAIQHCNKRRPLSTLLKSYRVKTLLLRNRRTILLKWIIAVTFEFWFHRLHVLFLVTKSASLKIKFAYYRTK